MKKIIKRRKSFRVNNPLSFGILCAMIFILCVGVAYALGAGVIAPAVRSLQLANATPTPTPTVAPVTATPSPSPAVIDSATPAPSDAGSEEATGETPTPEPAGKLSGYVIGVDPARSYSSKLQGVSTKIYANRLNYAVAEAVKTKLEGMGAKVVFTLTGIKDEKDSAARAAVLNSGSVDLAVRLECNLTGSEKDNGAIVWVPTKHSFLSDCEKLGTAILQSYIEETGFSIAKYNGASIRRKADNTPMEATEAPTCMLIMGYISNPDEDKKLNDENFQQRMADGVVKGILNYLGIQ